MTSPAESGNGSPDGPRADAVKAALYTVPTDAPEGDGTLAWDATTLVLVRARSGDTTGIGYTYGAPATPRPSRSSWPASSPAGEPGRLVLLRRVLAREGPTRVRVGTDNAPRAMRRWMPRCCCLPCAARCPRPIPVRGPRCAPPRTN
jgi:hypothetical protein